MDLWRKGFACRFLLKRSYPYTKVTQTISDEIFTMTAGFLGLSTLWFPKFSSVSSAPKAAGHNISHSDHTVMMRSIPRPSCSNRGKAYRDSKVISPNGAYLENAQLCQDWGTLSGRGFWMVLIPLIVQKSCYHHLGCIKMLYQRVRIFLVFRFWWNRPVPFDWWEGDAKSEQKTQ